MLGPTFVDEITAAGLGGLPFSWGPDGVSGRENLTPAQRATLDAVIAAHNPAAIRASDIRAATFRSDAGRIDLLDRLKTATPGQIDSFLAANVTTLAQARAVLAAIIKVIALDART